MPQAKRKVAKQRPIEELERIASWLYGVADKETAREARADLFFIEAEMLRQLWSEVRKQCLQLWRDEPAKYAEQIDRVISFHLLKVSEVCEFRGAEDGESYAQRAFHSCPA
jgi:hypothetical protein